MRAVTGKQAVAGRAIGLGLMAAAALLAGGCTAMRDHRGFLIDQALVDSVLPGVDNKNSVERTLGRPTLVSQFGDPVWYYIGTDTKQLAFRRPQASSQTILRVRFDAKGNVIAVDKAGTEKIVRLDPDKDLTPTLGRKRTLLEDLFGNIGTVGAGGGPASGGGGGGPGGGPNGS
jgi:outer membrane protein assembly factor BamE (lipoprotein component of BamABCDE complex)